MRDALLCSCPIDTAANRSELRGAVSWLEPPSSPSSPPHLHPANESESFSHRRTGPSAREGGRRYTRPCPHCVLLGVLSCARPLRCRLPDSLQPAMFAGSKQAGRQAGGQAGTALDRQPARAIPRAREKSPPQACAPKKTPPPPATRSPHCVRTCALPSPPLPPSLPSTPPYQKCLDRWTSRECVHDDNDGPERTNGRLAGWMDGWLDGPRRTAWQVSGGSCSCVYVRAVELGEEKSSCAGWTSRRLVGSEFIVAVFWRFWVSPVGLLSFYFYFPLSNTKCCFCSAPCHPHVPRNRPSPLILDAYIPVTRPCSRAERARLRGSPCARVPHLASPARCPSVLAGSCQPASLPACAPTLPVQLRIPPASIHRPSSIIHHPSSIIHPSCKIHIFFSPSLSIPLCFFSSRCTTPPHAANRWARAAFPLPLSPPDRRGAGLLGSSPEVGHVSDRRAPRRAPALRPVPVVLSGLVRRPARTSPVHRFPDSRPAFGAQVCVGRSRGWTEAGTIGDGWWLGKRSRTGKHVPSVLAGQQMRTARTAND